MSLKYKLQLESKDGFKNIPTKKRSDGMLIPRKRTVGPTLTKQEFIEECDVNNILKNYAKTGIMNEVKTEGIFGDFTKIPNYQTALDVVNEANEQFLTLDSKIRVKEFDNNPQKLMDFLADPENRDRAVSLGLVTEKTEDIGGVTTPPKVNPPQTPEAPEGA